MLLVAPQTMKIKKPVQIVIYFLHFKVNNESRRGGFTLYNHCHFLVVEE